MRSLPEENQTTTLASRIQQQIVAQQLKPGELLMTEEQISAHFGASRRVAREAIGRLRALGVLRARRRKGLVVGEANPVELLSESVSVYGRSPVNFQELARFRYTLEVGAVDLAVADISAEQVNALSTLAETYAATMRGRPDIPAAIRIEIAFHKTVLEATGSPLISGLHRVLLDYFHTAERLLPFSRKEIDESIWQHRAIATAFRRRDLEQVRSAVRQHLQPTIEPSFLDSVEPIYGEKT